MIKKSIIKFDGKQEKAIAAKNGYFLVLGSPGCGKTEILSERIVKAREAGVPFEQMCCMTFTNRASRGMMDCITKRIGEDAQNIFIGNIHRFCSTFLYTNAIIPENTSIIDEEDQIDILKNIDKDFFSTDDGNNLAKTVTDLDSYIQQRRYGHPKSSFAALEDLERYYEKAEKANFDCSRVSNKLVSIALKYRSYKIEHRLVDFTDLLIETYEHLRNDKGYKCSRFKWLQVDEVQDLTALQMAIIDELTDKSNDFTVMYLGDEQQAIFSFMGAKTAQLDALKKRCNDNVIHLGRNYRSPKYLLDILNTYAEKELGVDPSLLPDSDNNTQKTDGDVVLMKTASPEEEYRAISRRAKEYMKFGNERLAILVPKNTDADKIGNCLEKEGLSFFKVSGTDMFKKKSYKTLSSFFCVLANELNQEAWTHLLYGIGAFSNPSMARIFVSKLRGLMMTPFDLLENKSYLARFNEDYESREIVIFDTETTGLNVLEDDVVQIAAFKVKNGKKVPESDFNIFIHTDKTIPEKLGDNVNPLVDAYKNNKHFSKEEGLSMFLDYIGNDPILGHNACYDSRILTSNVKRYLGRQISFEVYDSLRLIKTVAPQLRMYKLEFLVKELKLSGNNSHLANEDIEATKSLVDYCYIRSKSKLSEQLAFMASGEGNKVIAALDKIKPLFTMERELLFKLTKETHRTIADELKLIYDELIKLSLIDKLGEKFDVFLDYVKNEWVDLSEKETIYDQIHNLNLFISEGDLINSEGLIKDRIFIMTVHKGKGLEFENVIVVGAVDGTYPYYKIYQTLNNPCCTPEEKKKALQDRKESARKFYVAISRAKKRLCVSYYFEYNGYPKKITPFFNTIQNYFSVLPKQIEHYHNL